METHVKLRSKVVPLIDYQGGRQWRPSELLTFMANPERVKNVEHMIVIFTTKDNNIGYSLASDKRDLKNSQVLWDLELAKKGLMEDS